jgi:hypothetical protein
MNKNMNRMNQGHEHRSKGAREKRTRNRRHPRDRNKRNKGQEKAARETGTVG